MTEEDGESPPSPPPSSNAATAVLMVGGGAVMANPSVASGLITAPSSVGNSVAGLISAMLC